MAKKRKKDKKEEEEYEFTPPEFDEQEFLQKEIKDTKTAILTIGYAIVFGIIAGGLAAIDKALVAPGILIGLAGIVSLRYFYKLMNFDISHLTRRSWVGTIGSFFMTFLAIWVLMINVPFMDLATPSVDKVVVWVDDGSALHGLEYKFVQTRGVYDWVVMNNDTWTPVIHATSTTTVNITARVADNGHLSLVEVAIGSQTSSFWPMTAQGTLKARYQYQFAGNTPDHLVVGQGLLFYIHAQDRAGNSITFYPLTTIPVVA